MTRYQTEFDMTEIPAFVKKVIFPIVLFALIVFLFKPDVVFYSLAFLVKKITEAEAVIDKKFADAPPPVK